MIQTLQGYRQTWCQVEPPELEGIPQIAVVHRFYELLDTTHRFLDRIQWEGHLTGSALPVTPDGSKVLLTLHKKLGQWLQLGGHADGVPEMHSVAAKEMEEESGITHFQWATYGKLFKVKPPIPLFFDLDIHLIPENSKEPAHEHFDVRYLAIVSDESQVRISDESEDLRWFTLEEALQIAPQPSMERQFRKIQYLLEQGALG